MLANSLLGVGMPHSYAQAFHSEEVWIQVLIGLAPSSQRAGAFLRNLLVAKEKLAKSEFDQLNFKEKIQLTTFSQMHLIESKI
jgi:hypothetical protein